ncbi:hypothetical protein [Streptomyces sp. B8F3]|uniref:hypothetical protein n=1 Tax=unclassified Streptomyces TaxID=2593676 RepID=UPI00325CEA96
MAFVGRVLRTAGVVAGAVVVLGGVLWLADDVLRGPPADSAQLHPAAGRSAGGSTYAPAEFAEHVTGVETEWEGDTTVRTVISTDLADDAAGRRIAAGIKVAHLRQLLADCVEKLPVVVVNDRDGEEIRHGDLLGFSRHRGDDCPARAPRSS